MLDFRSITLFSFLFFNNCLLYAEDSVFQSLNTLTEQWLQIENQRGSARQLWEDQKFILDQQIDLYSQNKNELISKIENSKKNRGHVDEERLTILGKQSKLETQQKLIQEKVNIAFHKLKLIQNSLPPPLKNKWNSELEDFIVNENKTGEALETLLSLLKDFYEFEDRIVLHNGNIINAQGESILVTQLFLGVSKGWYLSKDKKHYGYGESSAAGWRWWHKEEISNVIPNFNFEQIYDVIQTIENPEKAKIASLPIRIN